MFYNYVKTRLIEYNFFYFQIKYLIKFIKIIIINIIINDNLKDIIIIYLI